MSTATLRAPIEPVSDEELPPLRVSTAGSVDDGKSTLIGRLLHDSRSLFRDQLEQVERASRRRGDADTDLALVTDGLRAEREQGITIDVAWRYFATARRRFVLADTPGHVQYTRNMVTGCSTADAAVVLVDARAGMKDQSRRHLAVASLLRVRTVFVAVNKMDLINFDGARFAEVAAEAQAAAAELGEAEVVAVPISALAGDNVVERSTRTPYYSGAPLLSLLEGLDNRDAPNSLSRLAVQWVIRPPRGSADDSRGYAGRLSGGALHVGDSVRVMPAGGEAKIIGLEAGGAPVERVVSGESVIVRLDRDIDVSRGDWIVKADEAAPHVGQDLEADLVWLADEPARLGAAYKLKLGTRSVTASISPLRWRLDIATLARTPADSLGPNDVARAALRTTAPVAWDAYARSRHTGSFILIDPRGDTVAAGMLI